MIIIIYVSCTHVLCKEIDDSHIYIQSLKKTLCQVVPEVPELRAGRTSNRKS